MVKSNTPTFEPVYNALKGLFEPVVQEPLPSQWDELTLALDTALAKGDLYTDL